MAKKKRSKGRRGKRRSKRGAPKMDRATPLGVAGGSALSGAEILVMKTDSGQLGPVPRLLELIKYPNASQLDLLVAALRANMTDVGRYKGALIGVAVSASPKLPIIKMAAKPVDKAIRRMSKGKVSL